MEPFATVQELESGWKALSPAEETIAGTLILRATAQITTLLAKHHIEIDDTDEIQKANLSTVTCNMVRRSMSAPVADGISSAQQTIGGTNVSINVYNPDGAFYLSKMDKEILGIASGGRVGWTKL